MSAKSAAERYAMACEAIVKLQDASALMYDSAIYNSSVAKSFSDLVSFLSTGITILDPDKAVEFIKAANERATQSDGNVESKSAVSTMSGGYL